MVWSDFQCLVVGKRQRIQQKVITRTASEGGEKKPGEVILEKWSEERISQKKVNSYF